MSVAKATIWAAIITAISVIIVAVVNNNQTPITIINNPTNSNTSNSSVTSPNGGAQPSKPTKTFHPQTNTQVYTPEISPPSQTTNTNTATERQISRPVEISEAPASIKEDEFTTTNLGTAKIKGNTGMSKKLVYSIPDNKYSTAEEPVYEGQVVQVIQRSGYWYEISYSYNGKSARGWIQERHLIFQ